MRKLKFSRSRELCQLIREAGLYSYYTKSDGGFELLLTMNLNNEEDDQQELQKLLFDFHCECFYAVECFVSVIIKKDKIIFERQSERDLMLDDVEPEFLKRLSELFHTPDSIYPQDLIKVGYDIDGSLNKTITFDNFHFDINMYYNKNELSDIGMNKEEARYAKSGIGYDKRRSPQMAMKKMLLQFFKERNISESRFSIRGTMDCVNKFHTADINSTMYYLEG